MLSEPLNLKLSRWTGWAMGRVLGWIQYLDEELRPSNMDDWHEMDEQRHELAAEVAQLEAEMAGMKLMEAEGEAYAATIVRENERIKAENETLVDALEHCGYDPEDCIDCGGPPHNEHCRFWKLRHILSYWDEDIKKTD